MLVGEVPELADGHDLGSCAHWACGFESRLPHHFMNTERSLNRFRDKADRERIHTMTSVFICKSFSFKYMTQVATTL